MSMMTNPNIAFSSFYKPGQLTNGLPFFNAGQNTPVSSKSANPVLVDENHSYSVTTSDMKPQTNIPAMATPLQTDTMETKATPQKNSKSLFFKKMKPSQKFAAPGVPASSPAPQQATKPAFSSPPPAYSTHNFAQQNVRPKSQVFLPPVLQSQINQLGLQLEDFIPHGYFEKMASSRVFWNKAGRPFGFASGASLFTATGATAGVAIAAASGATIATGLTLGLGAATGGVAALIPPAIVATYGGVKTSAEMKLYQQKLDVIKAQLMMPENEGKLGVYLRNKEWNSSRKARKGNTKTQKALAGATSLDSSFKTPWKIYFWNPNNKTNTVIMTANAHKANELLQKAAATMASHI